MRNLIAILFSICWINTAGQVWVKGTVIDKDGERLPLAHISFLPDSLTTTSNQQGQFSIRLSPGQKQLQVSYVGYGSFSGFFKLNKDTTFLITLSSLANQLKEIVVSGERDYQREIFDSNRTSSYVLTKEEINSIPVLGGEADVIKTLQLLPGTIRGIEGTSDLFVRGGAADQNLVLFDGAPVYNTSHLFGFLSVFNPDVLEKVEAINGGFPAHYGGRLSSILDVSSGSQLATRTKISGDIGLIASRVYLEQPILKNKASFWVAGRRTYLDKVLNWIGEDLPYFFYDVNAKLILNPSDRDNITLSHYNGKDVLDWFRDRNNDGDGFLTTFKSGNNTQAFNWTRYERKNWEYDLSLFRTTYKYDIRNSFEENELVALSDIVDYGGKLSVRKDSLRHNGVASAGVDWTRHAVSPNLINTTGSFADWFESTSSVGRIAHEIAGYMQYEWSPIDPIRINTGIRMSSGIVKGKTYLNTEPRISVRYSLDEEKAVKVSYSRMVQYIHRISNSAVTSPTDLWYPVTDSINPQSSHQVAAAYQIRFPQRSFYLSGEGYYKTMTNLIGYKEGTNLFLNTDFESRLIQGRGRAYGMELLLRKERGNLTGWLSYTLSRTERKFEGINLGNWFPSRYDRRHNGALVMQYVLNSRLSASIVWEYISGARFTPVIGQYVVTSPSLSGMELIPVFSGINQVKLTDTHRLDVGMKYRSKQDSRYQWHWFIGVYNAYNRTSPIGINITQNETDGSLRYEQPGLFGLLPFVSYGFKL